MLQELHHCIETSQLKLKKDNSQRSCLAHRSHWIYQSRQHHSSYVLVTQPGIDIAFENIAKLPKQKHPSGFFPLHSCTPSVFVILLFSIVIALFFSFHYLPVAVFVQWWWMSEKQPVALVICHQNCFPSDAGLLVTLSWLRFSPAVCSTDHGGRPVSSS